DVADRDLAEALGDRVVALRAETRASVVHEDGDGVRLEDRAEVRDREVGPAVAVQVADRDRDWLGPRRGVAPGGEGARAVVEDTADSVRLVVAHDRQICRTVAVQVADRDAPWVLPGSVGDRAGKAAVALVQQHVEGAVLGYGRREVERAVAVQIADR